MNNTVLVPSSSIRVSYALINEIVEALNNKNIVGGIFCDLKKAFDKLEWSVCTSLTQLYIYIYRERERENLLRKD